MLTTAVFDLGNVLVRWDVRFLYKKMIPDPAELERFLKILAVYKLNERMDTGTPFETVAQDIRRDHSAFEPYIQAFLDRFGEMIPGPIEGSVALLEELRTKGVRTYALSNWSKETFPSQRQRFARFMDGFDGILISGEEGIKKPDPAFFGLLEKRFGVCARESAFIDDLESNVAAAKKLGFEAIRFTTPEALRAALEKAKLL